jgi:zinc transporter 7
MPVLPLIDTSERSKLGSSSARARRSDWVLKLLVSFAVGGLLGDVFLHLIPDAMEDMCASKQGNAQQGAKRIGLPLLGGMLAFFLAEKFIGVASGCHGHGHAHGQTDSAKEKKRGRSRSREPEKKELGIMAGLMDVRPAAYLNFMADFMHNFTDGLAMGVTFAQGECVCVLVCVSMCMYLCLCLFVCV